MNKEEIKHFKSLLRQGSLRHTNILLDDKFQKELLNIIKNYEELQQRRNKAIHRIQLLQMDNEVTVRDLGLIARDLKGDKEC